MSGLHPALDAPYRRASRWLLASFAVNAYRGSSAWQSRWFHPGGGWAYAYPETSGYILPTLYDCAMRLPDAAAETRKAIDTTVEWLLSLQLSGGAFPGGHVDTRRRAYLSTADYLRRRSHGLQPSIFNSAQILRGLRRHHAESRDARVAQAIERCAAFLSGSIRPDGQWGHDAYAGSASPSYFLYATAPLAAFAAESGDRMIAEGCLRTVNAVLERVQPGTGFITSMGFGGRDTAHTHTVGYTLAGALECDRSLDGAERGRMVAAAALEAILFRSELRKRMPGSFGPGWKGDWSYECLTGSFQLGLCFLDIHADTGDVRYLNAACRLHAAGARCQEPNGAFAGSRPSWGPYMRLRRPNWAVKYFMDFTLRLDGALRASGA